MWKSLPGWICLTRKHTLEILALIKKIGGYEKGIQYTTPHTIPSSSTRENTADLIDAFGSPGQWYEGKGGVHAPEEVFFPTMLALLGYLRSVSVLVDFCVCFITSGFLSWHIAVCVIFVQTGQDEVHRKRITYADWKKRSDANPITYSTLTPELYATIRGSGAYIGRKFAWGGVGVEAWRRVVAVHSGSGGRSQEDEVEGDSSGVGGKRTQSEIDTDETQALKKQLI
ncbi:hypothetical protein EON65_03595 [archaeon]|nr:MAG: hypothetical protein EON65_03595 [archaeon]